MLQFILSSVILPKVFHDFSHNKFFFACMGAFQCFPFETVFIIRGYTINKLDLDALVNSNPVSVFADIGFS